MDYRHTGTQRRLGQSAVPRRHDVRRVRQPRPRRLRSGHPPRARRRHQLHRHRRLLLGPASRRRSSARPWPAAAATTSCSPTKVGLPVRRQTRNQRGDSGAGSRRRSRTACAASTPTRSTSTRSTALIRTPTSTRRSACSSDLVHAGQVRAFGASTVPASQEIVEAQWAAERRGRERFRTEQPQYSILVPHRRGPTCSPPPAVRHGRADLQPARGRLAHRQATARARTPTARSRPIRRQRFAAMYDVTVPGQRGQARRRRRPRPRSPTRPASRSIQLAIAFVVRHPAVTSAIVGPRTIEHLESYLAADGVELSDDVPTASTRSCRPARSARSARAGGSAAVEPEPLRMMKNVGSYVGST